MYFQNIWQILIFIICCVVIIILAKSQADEDWKPIWETMDKWKKENETKQGGE